MSNTKSTIPNKVFILLFLAKDGFRSRASSTTIEDLNKRTIDLVVEFIREKFGLEEDRLESLEKQLNGLDLSGIK